MKKSMVGAKIKTPGMLRHVERLMVEFGLGRMSVSALVFLYRLTSRRGDWTHEVMRFGLKCTLSAKTLETLPTGMKVIEIKLVPNGKVRFFPGEKPKRYSHSFRVRIHRVMGFMPHAHQIVVDYATLATAHSRNIRKDPA